MDKRKDAGMRCTLPDILSSSSPISMVTSDGSSLKLSELSLDVREILDNTCDTWMKSMVSLIHDQIHRGIQAHLS